MGNWPEKIQDEEIGKKIKEEPTSNDEYKLLYQKKLLDDANKNLYMLLPWLNLSFWTVKNEVSNINEQHGLYYTNNNKETWLGDIYSKDIPWNGLSNVLNTESIRKFIKENYSTFKANTWLNIDIPWIDQWLSDDERKNNGKERLETHIISLVNEIKSTTDANFRDIIKELVKDSLGDNSQLFVNEWTAIKSVSLNELAEIISKLPENHKIQNLTVSPEFSWKFTTDLDKNRRIYKAKTVYITI